jgi:hypothetical protein
LDEILIEETVGKEYNNKEKGKQGRGMGIAASRAVQ